MGRTILCPHCRSTFDEDILKQRDSENTCLVCGKCLLSDGSQPEEPPKEKTKWYYYKDGGETLTTTLYSFETPTCTFDAVDVNDAKKQLKEVFPNSQLLQKRSQDTVSCPLCGCTNIQLIPRKYSLLTGFATNQVDRMCLRCKSRFQPDRKATIYHTKREIVVK